MGEIINTGDVAEAKWDGQSEPGELEADIAATTEATSQRLEFHVQMRGYTMAEMDDLIVEAAARMIVGSRSDNKLAKAIEAKCIELVDQKASAALSAVSAEIIDQPLTPNFGEKKPVTMREFLGLYGREYLEARVGIDGKPTATSAWGSSNSTSRIAYLVAGHLDSKFKVEIEKATNAAVIEVQKAVRANLEAFIAAEKARLAKALAKAVEA